MTEIWHSIENLETVSDLFSPKSIECDAKENHEKERQIPGGENGAKVMKTALKSETCLGLINNRLEKVNGLVKVCDNFQTEYCYWCCLLAVNGDVTSCKTKLKDNDIICNKVHRFD